MYIYGRNPVLEALRAGDQIEKIYILFGREGGPMGEIFTLAKQRGVSVVVTPKNKFFEIVSTLGEQVTHQGVLARRSEIAFAEIDDIFDNAARKKENVFMVLLDEIEDPHNFGAIVRTAECAGAHGVVTLKHHSASITPTVVKVSSGAVQHIPIVKVSNLAQTIELLKKENVWVVGTDAETTGDYTSFDFSQPVAVVIGSEGKGLRPLVKSKCDALVKIPMHGKVQSLNASVAAGVMMFEAARQRMVKTTK
ncbi:MAG TPA: 23S rRNA (guanosine(2251)-2'-O)-methyltransferase RlmB [Candidatus Kapabacteria bacterium]|nr:23S rRNA (guanosine(2251)-2'-O)-methyltransferase RlmB [Candidatus Kapabacteria bacterium]